MNWLPRFSSRKVILFLLLLPACTARSEQDGNIVKQINVRLGDSITELQENSNFDLDLGTTLDHDALFLGPFATKLSYRTKRGSISFPSSKLIVFGLYGGCIVDLSITFSSGEKRLSAIEAQKLANDLETALKNYGANPLLSVNSSRFGGFLDVPLNEIIFGPGDNSFFSRGSFGQKDITEDTYLLTVKAQPLSRDAKTADQFDYLIVLNIYNKRISELTYERVKHTRRELGFDPTGFPIPLAKYSHYSCRE